MALNIEMSSAWFSSQRKMRSTGLSGTISSPPSSTQSAAPSVSTSAGNQNHRRYHRGLSKQTMNESRYKLSGNTHRNGITAMSWQILFVTASSRTDAQAGKANQ